MSKYVDLHPAVLPIIPNQNSLRRFDFILNCVGWIGRLLLRRWVNHIEVHGLEHLKGGSKIILMNHSSPLDPVLLTFFGKQSLQFLVTEPFMAERKISRFVAWMGHIPKRKLDPDTRALRTMKLWCKEGGTVATFPEGQFSWDGQPLPLQPGLGELVRYLEVPVVCVRLTNGDRLWPAWATHPRKTSLRIEVDPPKVFQLGESVEEYVTKHLYVDPNLCTRWKASGKNLSSGMSKFLRFCFQCSNEGVLSDRGDDLICSYCQKSWRVTADNTIGEINVSEAWHKVRSHLNDQWKTSGVSLKSQGQVQVFDASRPQWNLVDQGELNLSQSTLRTGSWQVEVKDILAHTMDWGDLIIIRTARKRIAIRFPMDSRAVWTFALDEATHAI